MDLAVRDLATGYGKMQICRGVSFDVNAGRMVALVGRNGAGKSTLLRCIGGLLRTFGGRVEADGLDISKMSTPHRIKLGISHVPQELSLFSGMSVSDNLNLGAYLVRSKETGGAREFVYDTFPLLRERARQHAGTMSGGEQRMLAIGRGLMSNPKLLILDEPCTGLSPTMQERLFEAMRLVLAQGIGVLLAEQNLVRTAMEANEVLVIQRGELIARRAGARGADGSRSGDFVNIARDLAHLEHEDPARVGI